MWGEGVWTEIADPDVILLESYCNCDMTGSNNSRGHMLDKEKHLMPYGEIWAGKKRVREIHSEDAKALKCW